MQIEIVEDFKDRFNKALMIRNLRPIDIKEKTGISESAISQYRSGYAKPKQDKLYLLAKALRVNEAWLMGLDYPMDEIYQPIDIQTHDNEMFKRALAYYELYKNASPEIQQAVDAILKSAQPKP